MKTTMKKLADNERRRIQEALSKTEPGSEEYTKLLKQREQLEDIESKRRDGRIKPSDWLKVFVTITTTTGLVLADFWIPAVASKIKLGDAARHLFK